MEVYYVIVLINSSFPILLSFSVHPYLTSPSLSPPLYFTLIFSLSTTCFIYVPPSFSLSLSFSHFPPLLTPIPPCPFICWEHWKASFPILLSDLLLWCCNLMWWKRKALESWMTHAGCPPLCVCVYVGGLLNLYFRADISGHAQSLIVCLVQILHCCLQKNEKQSDECFNICLHYILSVPLYIDLHVC